MLRRRPRAAQEPRAVPTWAAPKGASGQARSSVSPGLLAVKGLAQAGRHQEALDALDAMLAAGSLVGNELRFARYLVATCVLALRLVERMAEAEPWLADMEQTTGNPRHTLERASMLFMLDRKQEAFGLYERALAQPDLDDASRLSIRTLLAEQRAVGGEPARGVAELVEVAQDSGQERNRRGALLNTAAWIVAIEALHDRYDDADRWSAEAMAIDPDGPGYLDTRSSVLVLTGRAAEAVGGLCETLEPETIAVFGAEATATAHIFLARAMLDLGDRAAAVEHARQADAGCGRRWPALDEVHRLLDASADADPWAPPSSA